MPKDDPSISEQIFKGIGDAITDIREKAVEEPWFGRAVTDRDSAPQWPAAKEPEQSSTADKSEPTREQEKPAEKEPDRDIDR